MQLIIRDLIYRSPLNKIHAAKIGSFPVSFLKNGERKCPIDKKSTKINKLYTTK